MSHESVITALNVLSKTRAYQIDVEEHVNHYFRESDRVTIILVTSTLEHILTAKLETMMPNLNGDERARIFGPEGPLGTFANNTRIGHGLGLFDRAMAKRLDIVRAMRNAAAHCVTPVSFDIAEFKDGVVQLFSQKRRALISPLNAHGLKGAFTHAVSMMDSAIAGHGTYDEEATIKFLLEMLERQVQQRQPSHETPEG